MILQTNDHVTFIKSIIRNASEEGRCVNEIESEEIANSLKAMLQECDDLENCMVTANQNTIKYESLIMKLNELMNCISEYPWVLDTAIDGIGELIVKVNQKARIVRDGEFEIGVRRFGHLGADHGEHVYQTADLEIHMLLVEQLCRSRKTELGKHACHLFRGRIR